MTKSKPHWTEDVLLRLRMIGSESQLISVKELWFLALGRTIMMFSLVVGIVAGLTMSIALRGAGDKTYLFQLLYSAAPVAVNIIASLYITASVYLRQRLHVRRGGLGRMPIVYSKVFVAQYVGALPVLSFIYFLKYSAGGLTYGWFI